MVDAARFRQCLEALLPQLRAQGGRIDGASLGNLLRSTYPDFSPGNFGARKLSELLAAVPELGVLCTSATPGGNVEFVLRESDVGGGASREASVSPEAEASLPLVQPLQPERHLDRRLWMALVSPNPPMDAFLDLGVAHIVYAPAGEVTRDMQSEPDRYVKVLPLDQAELQALAAEFASAADETALAVAVPGMPVSSWFPDFTAALSTRLRKVWLRRHRAYVFTAWCDWARQHGVAPRVGYANAKKTTPPEAVTVGAEAGSDLRATLHALIDDLTEAELLTLTIPLHVMAYRQRRPP